MATGRRSGSAVIGGNIAQPRSGLAHVLVRLRRAVHHDPHVRAHGADQALFAARPVDHRLHESRCEGAAAKRGIDPGVIDDHRLAHHAIGELGHAPALAFDEEHAVALAVVVADRRFREGRCHGTISYCLGRQKDEKMPAAYVIAEIEITHPEGYKEYTAQVPATIQKYGGRLLVPGGRTP